MSGRIITISPPTTVPAQDDSAAAKPAQPVAQSVEATTPDTATDKPSSGVGRRIHSAGTSSTITGGISRPATQLGISAPTSSGALKPRKRTISIPITTDLGRVDGNSQLLLSYTDAVDEIAARLEKELPQADSQFLRQLTRFGIATTELMLIQRGNVFAHEYGHHHGAREEGKDTQLLYFDFASASGVTRLEGPANDQELFSFQAGGMNQSETNLAYLHKSSARRGELDLGQALLTLSSALDDTSYIARTMLQEKNGDVWHAADPSNMRATFARMGKDVSYQHMLTKSAVADLLSTLNWDAMRTVGNYIATGDRTTKRTTFDVLGTEIMGPDVSMLRSLYDDNFRILTTVNPNRGESWDVRLDLRTNPEDWDINAIGARVQKLDAAKIDAMNLTISPYLGVSKLLDPSEIGRPEQDTVYDLGFEYRARIGKGLALVGDVGVGKSWDGALENDKKFSMTLKYTW